SSSRAKPRPLTCNRPSRRSPQPKRRWGPPQGDAGGGPARARRRRGEADGRPERKAGRPSPRHDHDSEKEMIHMAIQLQEMDEQVTFREQLRQDTGAVVLINRFCVAPEDTERLLQAWAEDATFMKQQPGYISTQLHRGIAGSTTLINLAVWESAQALARAFG